MNIPFTTFTLDNKLRVVIAPNSKAPVVTVTVAYKVGSVNESINRKGLAHLFEHLMFDNLDPECGGFDTLLTENGGDSNAWTTYDYTLYYLSLPANQLELGLWLEAERMNGFMARQSALDTQISVVSEEIFQNVFNQPYGNWRDIQADNAFKSSSPYSWEIYGLQEHVQAVTYSDAKDWYDTYYRPNNATLVITGDIDPAKTKDLIEKYFANLTATHKPIPAPDFRKEYCRSATAITQQHVPNDAAFISFHYDGFIERESPEADILSAILSDGRSSRLYKSMMFDKAIAAGIGSYPDSRSLSSLFTFYAFGADKTVSSAHLVEGIDTVLAEVLSTGITEQELVKAKNSLRTALEREQQTSSGVGAAIAYHSLFWNEPERINTYNNRYTNITIDDVMNFLTSLYTSTKRVQIEIHSAK